MAIQNKKIQNPSNHIQNMPNMPNVFVSQNTATQRDISKRSTLPPDRRSFQDQFSTPINSSISLTNNTGHQNGAYKIQTGQINLKSIQSPGNIPRSGSNGRVPTSNFNAQIQYASKNNTHYISSSNQNIAQTQQYDDLEKYRKQQQIKNTQNTQQIQQVQKQQPNQQIHKQNQSQQIIKQYQNQPTSIQYSTTNQISKHTQNLQNKQSQTQNQQRLPSDSYLNLPPSPQKQRDLIVNAVQLDQSLQQLQKQQNQTQSSKQDYLYNQQSQQNGNQYIDHYHHNQPVISPYSSPRPLPQGTLLPNFIFEKVAQTAQKQQQQQLQQKQQSEQKQINSLNNLNPQNNNSNFLSIKNMAFSYVDANQIGQKSGPNSQSASFNQNVIPVSPSSISNLAFPKELQPNVTKNQQISQLPSQAPSGQSSLANIQNDSPKNQNKIFNQKNQSIEDILKNYKTSKDQNKTTSIPQKVFSSTVSGGFLKNTISNNNSFFPTTNNELQTNYQSNGYTVKQKEGHQNNYQNLTNNGSMNIHKNNLQTSLPQQKNEIIGLLDKNPSASVQPDSIQSKGYSIQQKNLLNPSNINNKIIPNAHFTVSHTYDKNINSINQSNNTNISSVASIQNNQNFIQTTINPNQQQTSNTQEKLNNNIDLSKYTVDYTKKAIEIPQNYNKSAINSLNTHVKQNDFYSNIQSYPYSFNNSQNHVYSNISSCDNSPNLQYTQTIAKPSDISNNSILSSINYTTASGLTTSRINYNIPTTSVSTVSMKKQNIYQQQEIGENDQDKIKHANKDMSHNDHSLSIIAKRESEIYYKKAFEEIKPSEQVEKILEEIKRKNSYSQLQDQSKQLNTPHNAIEEFKKDTKQNPANSFTSTNKTPSIAQNNILQQISSLNYDVKGEIQNTISKNTISNQNQYQQLLYYGNSGNNSNEYTNNNNLAETTQQSVVDKLLSEIKRNDIKKQLQQVLTHNSNNNTNKNINTNTNNIPVEQISTQNNYYNNFNPLRSSMNQNGLDLSNNVQTYTAYNPVYSSPHLDTKHSYSPSSYQTSYQYGINSLYSQQPDLSKYNETENSKILADSKKQIELELEQLKMKQQTSNYRLSTFSNKKNQNNIDQYNNYDGSNNIVKDYVGSHQSFIEERESIQKFSTNCSQLTSDPLQQTKLQIINSAISKDSFKKDDLSASKQPVFSSMSISQNPNDIGQLLNYNDLRGTIHTSTVQQYPPIYQNETSIQPSSKDTIQKQQPPQLDYQQNNYEEHKTKTDSNLLRKTMFINNDSKLKYGEKDYYFVKKLGKGKHSEVFLAQDKKTEFLFAVKQVHKGDIINMGMEEQFSHEIKIQMCLNHPNIIRMYGYYEDENYFYLLMEYAPGGEIYRYQKTLPEGRFKETEASYYLMQLASALRYLHENNIIHRDIKPENLLISNGVVKLADFGYSRICDFKSTRSTFCGTLDYLSPQVVKGLEYNHDVDVWAFGVMVYEFLQGIAPFYEKDQDDTLVKISQGKYQFIQHISEEAKSFIKILLDQETKNRISMREVCRNPWMVQNSEIYKNEKGPIDDYSMSQFF